MLSRILFILEYSWRGSSLPDASQALEEYRALGLEARIRFVKREEDPVPVMGELEAAGAETLCLTDSARILTALLAGGAAAAGFLHRANRAEKLKGVDYLLEEPQWLSRDSLQKVWQRQRRLPWTILETARCLVREFTAGDLEDIYLLYDEEADRFLEAPSQNREREAEILRAYIDRIYRLYGYGQWAVLDKTGGTLIGRMGYSFPTGAEASLGADASFGFLLRRDFRHLGIAREVCSALVRYGFEELGFTSVSAEAAPENRASDALLRELGFERVEISADSAAGGKGGSKVCYYIKTQF